MPTYDYICESCGHQLELFQSMSEKPKRKCPACGALKLKRQIGAGAGFLFKGSGYYQTDYRSEGYKKAAEKDKKASTESAKKESSSKKDSGAKKSGTKKDSGSK